MKSGASRRDFLAAGLTLPASGLVTAPAAAQSSKQPVRLSYRWHITRDPEEATDVDVTFVDLGGDRTRLDIVQAGWERLGAGAREFRDANANGWGALVPSFVAAAERG